jgi:hypothetical protein
MLAGSCRTYVFEFWQFQCIQGIVGVGKVIAANGP